MDDENEFPDQHSSINDSGLQIDESLSVLETDEEQVVMREEQVSAEEHVNNNKGDFIFQNAFSYMIQI